MGVGTGVGASVGLGEAVGVEDGGVGGRVVAVAVTLKEQPDNPSAPISIAIIVAAFIGLLRLRMCGFGRFTVALGLSCFSAR